MSWDTKYRPVRFQDVVGQQKTTDILREILRRGEVFHKSYIFAGPSGTGKTTTARILARAMLCDHLDPQTSDPCNECSTCQGIINGKEVHSFHEMDAANNSGADNIRAIIDGLNYYTLDGNDRKIYLIDEAHALSKAAMDALLKPMEDSVSGSSDKRLVCLFCTTEPQKLRDTIKSRSLFFQIRDPERDDVVARLQYIAQEEDVHATDEALHLIFDYGKGHIRNMVTALERVSKFGDVTEDSVREHLGLHSVGSFYTILAHLGSNAQAWVQELTRALYVTDPSAVYTGIAECALKAYQKGLGITVSRDAHEIQAIDDLLEKQKPDILLKLSQELTSVDLRRINRDFLMCALLSLHQKISTNTLFYVAQAQPPTQALKKVQNTPVKEASAIEEENREFAEKVLGKGGGKAARGTPVTEPLHQVRSARVPVSQTMEDVTAPTRKDYLDAHKIFLDDDG